MSTTDTTVVTGQIARVLFEAPDGPFAAITITTDAGSIRAVGALAGVAAGQQVRLTGSWRAHPRHGRQFNVESVTAVDPVGERGAIAYLSRVPGIGKTRARALYAEHGAGVYDEIDANPTQVFESLRGVGQQSAQRAADWWAGARGERALRVLLASHQLGRLAGILVRRYGTDALATVRRDPYRLVEAHGVGFASADALAHAVGIDPTDPARTQAAVAHLARASRNRRRHLPPARDPLDSSAPAGRRPRRSRCRARRVAPARPDRV